MTPGQATALHFFFSEFEHQTLYDLAGHLRCSETEAWMEFLVAFGRRDDAAVLLDAHVEKDDEADSHYLWSDADQNAHLNELENLTKAPAESVEEMIDGLQAIAEETA